jgi:FlaA1/EpsC-like NDP-sugar epimerase
MKFTETIDRIYRYRRISFAACDAALIAVAFVAAVWLRFDGRVPAPILEALPRFIVLGVLTKLIAFYGLRLYDISWSQIGMEDMITVLRAVTAGSVSFWLVTLAFSEYSRVVFVPRAIILIDYVICLHLVGMFRMSRRVLEYWGRQPDHGRPALIVGAGSAGEQLARSLRQTPAAGYAPLGFVDDDPQKVGTLVRGFRVLGTREQLREIVREHNVRAVLIAMPSAPSPVIRDVVSRCRAENLSEIRIVPGLDRLLNGRISFTDLREIELTDLLGREVVRIDAKEVAHWLHGRTVVVTGAAGSIGSELSRQVAQFAPKHLVLVDCDESGLFHVEHDVCPSGVPTTGVLLDVRNSEKVQSIFRELRPNIVFHAAAYKHVGLMERYPDEAVLTNVFGTVSVAEASVASGVDSFVLISTDKAVRPTSVMGATKRLAEHVCLALDARCGTRFVITRFGNVLGSRGSVIPLFQEKIRRGDAITIRGAHMRRYFMAVSEAVLLVLQAGAMGKGSEVFVFDMGEPVEIAHLAHELIRLHGLEPGRDVPIIFAEPAPGEKDCEDLLTAEEGAVATQRDRIFVARTSALPDPASLRTQLGMLRRAAEERDVAGILDVLRLLVPTYEPSNLVVANTGLARAEVRRPGVGAAASIQPVAELGS